MPEQEDKVVEAPEGEKPEGQAAAAPEGAAEGETGGGEEHAEFTIPVAGAEKTELDPILQELANQGIKHEFETGADFVKSHTELRKLSSRVDEERLLGRELLPHVEEIRTFLAQREAEKQPKLWDPPELPGNADQQSRLPEEQQDPAYTRAARERGAYLEGKWQAYTANPMEMYEDHFRVAVRAQIDEALQQTMRRAQLTEKLEPEKEFISAHYSELRELQRQMPLDLAVELMKLRDKGSREGKSTEAQSARAADEKTLAKPKTGPVGVAKVTDTDAKVEETDEQIAAASLAQARLTV
jgi:hypothetical protein